MKERKENMNNALAEPSKSQRRRDALELKTLAARLIDLSPSRLAEIPLDDALRQAIDEARSFRSHGARKRQLQFAAKLLRRGDPEPIMAALDLQESAARQLNARHHRTEAWRDRLLEEGDTALGSLLQHRRDADAQSIRQLVRNAQREASRGKPPAASRRLFRLLREMDEREALPAV